MIIVNFAAILIFMIGIIWIWHNLGNIEKPRKVLFIIIGIFFMYVYTMFIFNMVHLDIPYPNEDVKNVISKTLILIFTGLNTLVILPYSANIVDKIFEEEIERNKANKRIIILVIIFLLCIFVEKGYLKNTQEGIINRYNNEVQNAER